MTTVIYAGILITAIVSCVWDVWQRRIPNALTFGSAAVGWLVNSAGYGVEGASFSAAGWAAGLVLFLPWFFVGGMGGGDVKLLAAFGAWLGPAQTAKACLYAMLAGGALALVVVTREGRLTSALQSTIGLVFKPRRRDGSADDEGRASHGGIAYAVPIAIGVGVAIWLR